MVEYAYNPLNQLTQYTDEEGAITSYTYNPDGLRNSKTPYDIDMDLTSAKDDRALEIKINRYVNTYKTYMSTSPYLIPSKIESRALEFKSWLSNSSTRIENLNKEYKSFMGE